MCRLCTCLAFTDQPGGCKAFFIVIDTGLVADTQILKKACPTANIIVLLLATDLSKRLPNYLLSKGPHETHSRQGRVRTHKPHLILPRTHPMFRDGDGTLGLGATAAGESSEWIEEEQEGQVASHGTGEGAGSVPVRRHACRANWFEDYDAREDVTINFVRCCCRVFFLWSVGAGCFCRSPATSWLTKKFPHHPKGYVTSSVLVCDMTSGGSAPQHRESVTQVCQQWPDEVPSG